MTPGARAQAAIELLDLIVAAAREGGAAADAIVQRYFAGRRYAGSKDRRAIRELVYRAIRACGDAPPSGRAALLLLARDDPELASAFDGSAYGPSPITPGDAVAEPGIMPGWLADRLRADGVGPDEQQALIDRAPLDLRVNRLRASVSDVIAALGGPAEAISGLTDGLRLPSGTSVAALNGLAEVQDAGSQIVSMAAHAQPGERVVDLCAGAGGKTLALAAAMANEGAILACDTDRARLSRLPPRAQRAGVTIVETRLLNPMREAEALSGVVADTVLIDAPCSGTGTWRRNPEARWRITPDRLARLVATQARLLELGASLTRPGGALVYIVCSLLDEEGADRAEDFLAAHPGWRAVDPDLPRGATHRSGVRLTPASDDTDGFFVARLIAPC